MDPVMIRVESPTQALIVERALVFAKELEQVATRAADGQVLAEAERCTVDKGRDLLRFSLQAVLQAQAESVEKKGYRPARVPPAANDATTKVAWPGALSRPSGR